jgi:hypothetical protein
LAAAPSGTFVPSAASTVAQVSQTSASSSNTGGALSQNLNFCWQAAVLTLLSICLGGILL